MGSQPDRAPPGEGRQLDFIVIGAQKGGTTSLWQYLRRHPQVAMPDHKESPVLCAGEDEYGDLLRWFMRSTFRQNVARNTRCGKVATHYMVGWGPIGVEQVVDRIAAAFPDVHLIALLRDPIERAMSQYRMSKRRGFESRGFEAAVEELLSAAGQEEGKACPSETNTYLTQGEYGRVLRAYVRRFPPERIHVEWTTDLARDPGGVLDRVLGLLGLPPGYRPEGLGVRHHRGGSRVRIDAEAQRELEEFMRESVWPRLGAEAGQARRAFEFFLRTWNVIPDDELPSLSPRLRARLQAHYRQDAEMLLPICGVPPWLAAWGGEGQQP